MSRSHLTVSNKLVIPVSANVSKVTPAQEGAVVYDKTSGLMCISNGREWVTSSSRSLRSTSSSDRAITSDTTVNSVTVFKSFTFPAVQNVSTTPLFPLGSTVYNKATGGVFVSGPTGWSSIGGGVALITAANSTIVVGGTATNPTIAGNYVAGTNISIVGNTISVTGASGVASITAANSTIVVGGTATNPTIAGNYVAGNGIMISGNTITATTVSTITAGNTTITIGGTATNPTIAGNYIAGTNISIVGNTISNTGVLTTTAANSTIAMGGTPTNRTVSGNYVGGAGISVVGNIIANTGVVTLTAANTTVVVGGTSSNPTIAGNYVAGSDISIVGNAISSTAGSTPQVLFSVSFSGYADLGKRTYVIQSATPQAIVVTIPYMGSSVIPITSFSAVIQGNNISLSNGNLQLYDPVAALVIATISFTNVPETLPPSLFTTTTIANLPVAATALQIIANNVANGFQIHSVSIQ